MVVWRVSRLAIVFKRTFHFILFGFFYCCFWSSVFTPPARHSRGAELPLRHLLRQPAGVPLPGSAPVRLLQPRPFGCRRRSEVRWRAVCDQSPAEVCGGG